MANWKDFAIDSVQTAMFTPEHASFAAGRSVATILRHFGEQFDGEMQALPLPAEMPAEVPRVVLQSADTARRLNISPARFDAVWNRLPGGEQPGLGDVVRQSAEVLEYYVGEMSVQVGRIGLIVRRSFPTADPAQFLVQRFCNAQSQREPFNRSSTFEIHNHKAYAPSQPGIDYSINSWVRCRSAAVVPDNRQAIVVVQDLNTMGNELEQRRFNADQIRVFFEMAAQEADQILGKYFPE